MNSPIRPYNPDEVKKVDEQLKAFYDDFVAKVAESRHKTSEEINRIGQGRVWTGQQAKAIGLVDALGGLERAVAIAKERAKIPGDSDVELVVYPAPKSFYELLSDQVSGNSDSAAIGKWLKANLSAAEFDLLRTAARPRGDVQTRRAARVDANAVLTMNGFGLQTSGFSRALSPSPKPRA